MCEVIDVPEEIKNKILSHIQSSNYICDGYARYVDEFIPIVEPWLTQSLQKLFPYVLVTGSILYLGGGPADLYWHIDADTRYWGSSYKNCTIPLYIDTIAGIKTIEDTESEFVDLLEKNIVDEGNSDEVELTLVDRNSKYVSKKYKVQTHLFEKNKAYIFSAGKPHRTLPGGMRISLMFNFITDPTLHNPKIYYLGSTSLFKHFNTIFQGKDEEKTEVAFKRYKDQNMDKNKLYYTTIDNAWRVCWINTFTLFKKLLNNNLI